MRAETGRADARGSTTSRAAVTDSGETGAGGLCTDSLRFSFSVRQRLRFPFISGKWAQRSFDLLQVPSLTFFKTVQISTFKKVRKEKPNALTWLRNLLTRPLLPASAPEPKYVLQGDVAELRKPLRQKP